MRRSTVVRFASLSLFLSYSATAQNPFGKSFEGDGTYYAFGGEKQGHCSLGISGALSAPWTSGVSSFVALNNPQYTNSQLCGLCVQLTGLGPGIGQTPVPSSPQYALIADECPECKKGDLDIASNGDGRWRIKWNPVQCGVGDSTFRYSFQGSNQYYAKVSVTNARVPVQKMMINIAGSSAMMTRSIDNYFIFVSGTKFSFPISVTLTSILGDVVTDSIPVQDITSSDPVTGTAQFPLKADLPAVSPSEKPHVESASPVEAIGRPVLTRPVTPSAAVGSTAIGSTPPSSNCQSSVNKYSQCGGLGGQCGTKDAPCVDARWPGACCSTGFACTRINSYWHQCNRATSSGSIEAADGVSQINDYAQCGGLAAISSNVPTGVILVDGPWINTTCSSGFVCVRYDPHFYQCSDFPYLTEAAANVESVGASETDVTLNSATCQA